MAALTIAQKTIGRAVSGSAPDIANTLLDALLKKGHLTEEDLSTIKEDEEIKALFKAPTKKSSKKKSGSKKASDPTVRNLAEYQSHCCDARLWKPADEEGNPSKSGKYGLDNVQCLSTKMDGSCWCEKHMKINEAMDGNYWLGKVNEPRPERLMLPKGSLKKGYDMDTLIPHYWRFDSNGEINSSKKKSSLAKEEKEKAKEEKKKEKELAKAKAKEEKAKAKEEKAKAKEEKKKEEKKEDSLSDEDMDDYKAFKAAKKAAADAKAKAKAEAKAKAKAEAEAKAKAEAEAKAKAEAEAQAKAEAEAEAEETDDEDEDEDDMKAFLAMKKKETQAEEEDDDSSDEDDDSSDEETEDMSDQESVKEDDELEEDDSKEPKKPTLIEIDDVAYHLTEDCIVVDPEGNVELGLYDEDNKEILFRDESCRQIHEDNKDE